MDLGRQVSAAISGRFRFSALGRDVLECSRLTVAGSWWTTGQQRSTDESAAVVDGRGVDSRELARDEIYVR